MNELNVLKRICRHLFLAVLLCAVSAATASAQVPTVTVDAKNVTIKELLQRIEANSQYTFAYIDADINPDKRVSVKAVNRSIASIIAEVLPNVNMEVKGLKIVLTAKRGGESQTRPAADAGRTEIRRAQSKRAEERGRRKAEQARRLHRRGREKGRGSAASPAREDRGP